MTAHMVRPEFLYFDMGNVMLNFDHHRGCRQMAAVAGISEELVWKVLFAEGAHWRHESGELNLREYFDLFRRATNSSPDFEAWVYAGGAIFEMNRSMKPLLGSLSAARFRMGILSNTCEQHWKYVTGRRFGLIPKSFEILILSHEVKVMKPDPAIYHIAIERTGLPANRNFFVDDRADNVEAAQAAGMDAILFTSASEVAQQLRLRGLNFNY